jgi:hypothetical protein
MQPVNQVREIENRDWVYRRREAEPINQQAHETLDQDWTHSRMEEVISSAAALSFVLCAMRFAAFFFEKISSLF